MKKKVLTAAAVFTAAIMLITLYVIINTDRKDSDDVRSEQIVAVNEIKELYTSGETEIAEQKTEELAESLRKAAPERAETSTAVKMCIICIIFMLSVLCYIYFAVLRPFEKLESFAEKLAAGLAGPIFLGAVGLTGRGHALGLDETVHMRETRDGLGLGVAGIVEAGAGQNALSLFGGGGGLDPFAPVMARHGDGPGLAAELSATDGAADDFFIIAVCLAGSGDLVFMDRLAPAVLGDGAGLGLAAQLSAADGAVIDLVVMALGRAGGSDLVFMDRLAPAVIGHRDGLGLAAQLGAAGGAVIDLVVMALGRAGGGDLVFMDRLAPAVLVLWGAERQRRGGEADRIELGVVVEIGIQGIGAGWRRGGVDIGAVAVDGIDTDGDGLAGHTRHVIERGVEHEGTGCAALIVELHRPRGRGCRFRLNIGHTGLDGQRPVLRGDNGAGGVDRLAAIVHEAIAVGDEQAVGALLERIAGVGGDIGPGHRHIAGQVEHLEIDVLQHRAE